MGKYIVELKKNETLYKAATRESDGTAYVCSAIGTPYTEPDLEQIRKEAYEQGYDDAAEEKYTDGLADAWEAARKIANMIDNERFVVLDTFFVDRAFSKNTAAEAIAKIKAWEDGRQEIKVGDEVENTQTSVRFIRENLQYGGGG